MADGPSNEVVRQMLAGFNGMQSAMGLLPTALGSPAIGVGPAYVQPPPPPPVMHPSAVSAGATQQHQVMIQQTLQAAQATRYATPPSAPTPSTMQGGMGAQLNPFVAASLGTGYGMPSPTSMTSPAFGMFRPMPAAQGGPAWPRPPSIFNPFSAQMPTPHFMTPATHGLQMIQSHNAQAAGALAGVGELGMGVAGSVIGGALGSAFGPLGTVAGSWLGSKAAGVVSSMAFGPAVQDMAQGRLVQRMTAPFMVSGQHLGAGGQGLSTPAGQQVASGIRNLWRDVDFERTGFNAADATRIMGHSAQQGLLTGAQDPGEMVRRVKEISKTVKVLMQITGDPDVREAIASLGQMRTLGFQGLASQAGAVASRATFARMAGVSQAAMHESYGMPGAMMAQQVGLSGATGYAAGMAGGALSNLAASSGALNDLQLARAGGKAGLAQINTLAQISATQSDVHLMAALKKGGKGLEVDMDAYRRAQSMSVGDVAREAAERARGLGAEGLFEWRTRRQEFKDQIAQKLSPLEAGLNVVRQARGLRGQVPGMSMGSAIFATVQSNAVGAGMGEDQAEQAARSLELQFSSRGYWDAQAQQLRAQRRQAVDQDRASRERYRTRGVMARGSHAVRGFLGDVSDDLSSPYRRAVGHLRRVGEDEEAARYGERITRSSSVEIAGDDQERAMARTALRSQEFQTAFARSGESPFGREGSGGFGAAVSRADARQANRMTSFFGLSAVSDENRLVSIASKSRGSSFGWHPFASFGDTGDALGRVHSVTEASKATLDAESFGVGKADTLSRGIAAVGQAAGRDVSGVGVMLDATRRLMGKLPTAGFIRSAGAVSGEEMRGAFVAALTAKGVPEPEARRAYEANKGAIHAQMAKDILATGDKAKIETFMRAQDVATDAGAISAGRSRKFIEARVDVLMEQSGLTKKHAFAGVMGFKDDVVDEATQKKMKGVLAHHDVKTVALMAALSSEASGSEAERGRATADIEEMRRQMGDGEFNKRKDAAQALMTSMDSGTRKAFRRLESVGEGGAAALEKRVGLMGAAFGGKMAIASQKAFIEKMSDISGNKGGATTPEDALRQLSEDDLDRLGRSSPEKAALLRKARSGDRQALEDAIMSAGPSSTEERLGSSAGEAVARVDKQIAEVEAMRDQMGADNPSGQLDAASAELFAASVKQFAEAINDLKGNGEKDALKMANPFITSLFPSIGGR